MAPERKNFYRLLDLSPEVDDPAQIRKRIQEKQRQWATARIQGSPKAQREAQKALGLISEIEAVMADPEKRRTEASAAREEEAAEKRAHTEALDEAIDVLRSAGGYDTAQLDKLARKFGPHFSRREIADRLRTAGVSPESEGEQAEARSAPRQRIDKVIAGKIAQNLEPLGCEDLYAFLGLQSSCSPRALSDRAEEIYRATLRSGRTDADTSARSALAGLAKTIFRDDPGKDRYDAYLAVRALEGLETLLDLAGSDRLLTVEELDRLVEAARKRGVPAAEARGYFEEHARQHDWVVQKAGPLQAERLRRCGLCGALTPPDSERCQQCGEELEIDCPKCGERSPSEHRACRACGCHLGDAALVRDLLREGREAMVEGRLTVAVQLCEKALLYWPGWEPALKAKRQAEERRKQLEEEVRRIEDLVGDARLMAATRALEQLARKHGGADFVALRRRVERSREEAERLFRQGAALVSSGRADDAAEKLAAALEICSDHDRARRALESAPPKAPTDLRVALISGGFRLTWKGPGRGLSYRVLRKSGGAPNGPRDGETISEVAAPRADDPAAAVGVVWYYAVFAVRGGVVSPSAAVSGPNLKTAEVDGLEVVAGDRQVTLTWEPPPGCLRVEVWRREGGPPKSRGDGLRLPSSRGLVVDVGLINGRAYGYRLVSCFAGGPAKETATAGTTVVARPIPPPAAVDDLRAERSGREIRLSWTPPPGAAIQIRRFETAPKVQAGDILAASGLERLGTAVPNAARGRARDEVSRQGRIWFLPFSIAGGVAVVGRPTGLTFLDPLGGLEARRAGRSILLTWSWPDGVDEALVCWDHAGPLDAPDPTGARSARVTRREYEREGGWTLRHPQPLAHHFAAFARGAEEGLHSTAAHAFVGMGREVTVRYEVAVRRSLLGRKVLEAWLDLTAADGCAGLGPVIVVAKRRSVPLSPRDGEVCAELPSLRFDRGRAQVPIPPRWWGDQTYVKLFFKNPSESREIRLLPAPQDRLRVA